MSTEDHHMSGDAEIRRIDEQSRRFACDRCRGQKLRCERRLTTGSSIPSCNRCVKARCKCFTSPPRQMGRPKHKRTQIQSTVQGSHKLGFDTSLPSMDAGYSMKNDFEIKGTMASSPFTIISPPMAQDHGGERDGEFQQVNYVDFGYNPQQSLADTPLLHGDQGYYNKKISQTSPPADPNEECLQKLSDLSSRLFRQWSRISSGQLADWLTLFPPSLSSTSQIIDASIYFASDCAKSPIGHMLDGSQEFLDILRYFPCSPSAQSSISSPYSSPGSPYSFFDHGSLSANYSDGSSTHSASPIYLYSPSHIFSDGSSSANSDLATSTNSLDSSNLWRPDAPTSFATLTCYICLVRIYSTIFSHIHDLLLSRPSQPESTPILPGLQLGDFQLESNRNLQINILLQVSVHMLSQIETALGLPGDRSASGNGGGGGGILEDSISTALLEIVLKQGTRGNSKGEGTATKSLKQTLDSIKGLLRERTES